MKTLKKATLILMITGVLASCDTTLGSDQVIIDNQETSNDLFFAEVTASQSYLIRGSSNAEIEVESTGEGYSELMGAFRYETSHIQGVGENFSIRDGEFKISNDFGDELRGRYSGNGNLNDVYLEVQQNWIIEEGDELFKDATGSLVVHLDNHRDVNSIHALYGSIEGNINYNRDFVIWK